MDSGENVALPSDIASAIQAIRDDRDHGASWLARAAASVLLQLCEPRGDIPAASWSGLAREAARALVSARPSMAAVANAAARIWNAGQSGTLEAAREAMREAAARLSSPDAAAQQAMRAHAEKLLVGSVYTMSRSGTVEDVLRALVPRGVIERVLIAESRPGGEGIALARALARDGMPVTVIADTASGDFIGEATCVLLGADSLRADGSLINKVGSYPLALVAREAGKLVYVLCETLKIAAPNFPLTLEEMGSVELVPDEIPGLEARNPYFDITPARLITSYITEAGILDQNTIERRAQAAGAALRALMVE
jgi:translation initiation factor 2B subunit (eIF-2B alpha/beta/delta family)